MDDQKNGTSVKSLQVALDILEAIADHRDDIGISELATQLNMTKGSVFRYMKTLSERGYLSQDDATSRYRLGMRLHVLGELASSRIDLISAADPVMRQLRDELSLTVNLAGVTTKGVIVLRSHIGTQVMEIGVRVGSELPFSATSQGRAIMAFSKRQILQTLRRQTLVRFTDYTLTDFAAVEAQVALARERGWAMALQETVVGINAVSVPIFAADGDCIAAITLVGSMQYLPEVPEDEQLDALFRAGERISVSLGFRGFYPRRPRS